MYMWYLSIWLSKLNANCSIITTCIKCTSFVHLPCGDMIKSVAGLVKHKNHSACGCPSQIDVSPKSGQSLKVALGVSPQFFSIWTRVLNHNKYVEINKFSKEDIKQNNISTVILLIKFLVYQWDPRHCKEVGLFTYLFILYIRVLFNI